MQITLWSETSGKTNLCTRVLRSLYETLIVPVAIASHIPIAGNSTFLSDDRSKQGPLSCNSEVTCVVVAATLAATRFAARPICAARGFSWQNAGYYVVAPDLVWTCFCSRFAVA